MRTQEEEGHKSLLSMWSLLLDLDKSMLILTALNSLRQNVSDITQMSMYACFLAWNSHR